MDAQSPEGHRKRLRERFNRSGLAAFLDYEIVELLLKNKADATAQNNEGKTPVDEAVAEGHNDIAELLRGKKGN